MNKTTIKHHEDLGDGKYIDAEMEATDLGFTMDVFTKHPEFAALVTEAIVNYFDACHGVNYVTMSVTHAERGVFSVTIQREGGKTPAEKLAKYEKALLEINTGEYGDDAIRLAQEALRCE